MLIKHIVDFRKALFMSLVFVAFMAFASFASFCKAQSEQVVLGEGEVLVEMVDYKRSIIIGYMVLKNGNIIKKVRFSQPKSILQAPPAMQSPQANQNPQMIQNPMQSSQQSTQAPQSTQNPQATQSTQNLATQSEQNEYEKQISQKPKKEKRSWFASKKKQPKHITKNMIESDLIPQESGAESSEVNSVYKNRQWDKSKIPHNVKSQVINLGD
ncbi:hypothetical protein [Helicobacter sp. T3_23-1056]